MPFTRFYLSLTVTTVKVVSIEPVLTSVIIVAVRSIERRTVITTTTIPTTAAGNGDVHPVTARNSRRSALISARAATRISIPYVHGNEIPENAVKAVLPREIRRITTVTITVRTLPYVTIRITPSTEHKNLLCIKFMESFVFHTTLYASISKNVQKRSAKMRSVPIYVFN